MINIALKWLASPPSQWSLNLTHRRFQPWVGEDPQRINWQELVDRLNFIAQRSAMLAEYIGERTGDSGCGTREHAEAVKSANKRLIKVRKALGYSYPNRGTINF